MINYYLDFAEFYDLFTDNVEYKKQWGFIKKCVEKYSQIKPEIIIDIGCGTGSLSLLIADEYNDVIAIDPSEEMLDIAKQRANKMEKDILFLNQSMESLDLYGTVDLAVSTLDTINHITSSKVLKTAFEKVSLFLVKGGLFIFDVNSLYKHEKVLGDNSFVFEREDVFCVWQNSFNAKTKITTENLDFFKRIDKNLNYQRYFETIKEKFHTGQILNKYLKSSGFEILDIYDDYDFKSCNEKTQRITYVTKKVN
ncbi:MAG: class I SAM-dependent methyltransferase [Oscillospiraceae bacterium]